MDDHPHHQSSMMATPAAASMCGSKSKKLQGGGERSSTGGGGGNSPPAAMRKGPWTEEEDAQLVWFVRLFGERRSEAHRQELPPAVGQLPPPGAPARLHHRRRGAPDPAAPRAVGQPVVAHRQEPPGPHRQRDQELLEDARQEAEGGGAAAEQPEQQDGVGVLGVVVVRDCHHVQLLWLSESEQRRLWHGHHVIVRRDRVSAAAKQRRQRQRRRRRRARRGVHHHRSKPASVSSPAAAAGVLRVGPVLERHRGGGGGELHVDRRLGRSRSWPSRRLGGRRAAFVTDVGVLRLRFFALEDRRRRVLQEDARLLLIQPSCMHIDH